MNTRESQYRVEWPAWSFRNLGILDEKDSIPDVRYQQLTLVVSKRSFKLDKWIKDPNLGFFVAGAVSEEHCEIFGGWRC